MSTERGVFHRATRNEPTGTLTEADLDAVNGGFIIDGSMQALGGPDTKVWAGMDLLRSKNLDRNSY